LRTISLSIFGTIGTLFVVGPLKAFAARFESSLSDQLLSHKIEI